MSSNENILNPQNIYNFTELIELDELNYDNVTDDLKYLIKKIDKKNFTKKLRHSIDIIEQTFTTAAKTDKQVCVAFNGGKDCCVALYVYYLVAVRMCKLNGTGQKLNILLLELKPQFDELNGFIGDLFENFYQAQKHFNLVRIVDHTIKMKDSLNIFKKDYTDMLYIIMGTRRGDSPYAAKLNDFSETDSDWPYFIRVNPLLDWSYSELWYFIRRLRVPYCRLYDLGYSSLGDPQNTIKNQALFNSNTNTYLPAYMLDDEQTERNSRI